MTRSGRQPRPSWPSTVAGLFSGIFAFFVVPGQDVRAVLYEPRLWLLAAFVVCWAVAAFVSDRETSLRDLPRKFATLPIYERLLLAYMGAMVLASLLSPVPGFAFLGDSITLTGSLFQFLLFGIFFVFRRISNPESVLRALAACTLALALINVAESLGARPALVFFPETYSDAYPRAGIGRESVIVGLYVLLAGMASASVLQPRISRGLAYAWLLAAFVGVALNPGKAGWLAILAVLVLVLVAAVVTRRQRVLLNLVACVAAAALVSLSVSGLAARIGVSGPGLEERVATSTTLETRLLLWKASWRMLLERPLLGWGDDNFKLEVFDHLSSQEAARLCRLEYGVLPEHETRAFGNVCMMQDEDGNLIGLTGIDYIWPHNILAQIAVSHGVVGLGLFVAFLVSLAVAVAHGGQGRWVWLVGPAGFLVYLMGFFYIVPIAPYFWLCLGIASNPAISSRPQHGSPLARPACA